MRRLDEFLNDLEPEALAHVLSELVRRHPELRAEAEALCEAAQAVYAGSRVLPPIDLAQVQASLRVAFQAGRARFSRGLDGAVLAAAIAPWSELAREHLEAGAGEAVLDLLAVILDELAEAGDAIDDHTGDLHKCVLAMGSSFATALLRTPLTEAARIAWERRIEAWSENLESFLGPEVLRAARLAAPGSGEPG